MDRQLQIMAYLTLRSISCYKNKAVCQGTAATCKLKRSSTLPNVIVCASMCGQRQTLTLFLMGGDNISCAMTETCGIICVGFVVTDTTNHRHTYLQLPDDPACMQTGTVQLCSLGPFLGLLFFSNTQKVRVLAASACL